MKTFLTVGTDFLSPILQQEIINSSLNEKPKGGLWLTQYQKGDLFNPWVEYLSYNPHLIIYKGLDIHNIPCAYVTLKDNCRTLIVNNDEVLKELMQKYPYHHFFSYQKLAQDYDGIYFDFTNSLNNPLLQKLLPAFCISSFILFDLNMVEYYEPGSITPLGFYGHYCFEDYKFNFTNECQYLKPATPLYFEVLTKVQSYLKNYLTQKGTSTKDYQDLYNEVYEIIAKHFHKDLINLSQKENIRVRSLINSLISKTL